MNKWSAELEREFIKRENPLVFEYDFLLLGCESRWLWKLPFLC